MLSYFLQSRLKDKHCIHAAIIVCYSQSVNQQGPSINYKDEPLILCDLGSLELYSSSMHKQSRTPQTRQNRHCPSIDQSTVSVWVIYQMHILVNILSECYVKYQKLKNNYDVLWLFFWRQRERHRNKRQSTYCRPKKKKKFFLMVWILWGEIFTASNRKLYMFY